MDYSNPMFQLFFEELQTFSTLIQDYLQTDAPQSLDSSKIRLIRGARDIEGGAKILQLEGFQKLAKALIKLFDNLFFLPPDELSKAKGFLRKIRQLFVGLDSPASIGNANTSCIELAKQALQILKAKAAKDPAKAAILKPPSSLQESDSQAEQRILNLFKSELESHLANLSQGLLHLEENQDLAENLQSLMRSAHSIKGNARVMGLEPIVHLAHAMEDVFVAAQNNQIQLGAAHVDVLLQAVDLLARLLKLAKEEFAGWLLQEKSTITRLIKRLAILINKEGQGLVPAKELLFAPIETPLKPTAAIKTFVEEMTDNRVLRVSAQSLDNLMGLAGESLVESQWLKPFSTSLIKIKRNLYELSSTIGKIRGIVNEQQEKKRIFDELLEVQHKTDNTARYLTDRLADLDTFILRYSSLSDRLYQEVIESRMRPFNDGIEGMPRMVRDLCKKLGKMVKLEIKGKKTPIDRDILEKLKAPLDHLLRNAIDHGIELPEKRVAQGRPPEGTICLEAAHQSGMLSITVTDDGEGIDIPLLRKKIIKKNLLAAEFAETLKEPELLEFLFLPGFSTTSTVTEISGRGVGLNVVQSMVQEVGGKIRIKTTKGKGVSFILTLPLTLSVLRALLVDIGGEPYAFPLTRIDRALVILPDEIETIEHQQYIKFEGQNIGLIHANRIFSGSITRTYVSFISVILISDYQFRYGIIVDRFLGEKEFVVQELDERLGSLPNISAGALMEDGSPLLIVDVEDMLKSIEQMLVDGRLTTQVLGARGAGIELKKNILIVEDSSTVRELESQLLVKQGYEVQCAVDGIEGWNLLRTNKFDLIIVDIDMPRLNGVELVKMVRAKAKFRNLPILILSYKEREEDRLQAFAAGANEVLAKTSLNDETFLKTIFNLIGQS